jgi:hypothetical protein
VNELAERRQRDRINDKLSRFFNSELRERESGCSSPSPISLQLPEAPNDTDANTERTEDSAPTQALLSSGAGERLSKREEPEDFCNADC